MNINQKKPNLYIILFGIIIVFIIQSIFVLNMSKIDIVDQSNTAEKGDIFIQEWDNVNYIFALDGEWEQFDELITPSNIASTNINYEYVPSSWSSGFFPLKYKGVSTYRIRVHVPKNLVGERIGIRTSNIRQDYRIFIQSRLLFENGSFSKKKSYYPFGIPRSTFFELKNSTFEIIIQVKNELLNNPGIAHSILIGREEVIRNFSMTKNNMDLILFSTLISISIYLLLYFWIFYSNNYINFNYLILSLNAFMFALSTGGYREKLLYQFLYGLDTSLLIRIHDLSKIGYFLTLLVLFYNARKYEYPKFLFNLLTAYVSILLCMILLIPISIYGAYFDFFTLSLYGFLAIVVLLEVKIIFRKVKNIENSFYVLSLVTLPALYGFTILVYQSTNIWFDILVNSSIIVFVFFMLSHTFIDGIKTIKKNQTLSEQVLINKFAFLQSQIKPHFLFNTFSSIQGLIEYDSKKAQILISNLSDYLRRAFDFNPNNYFNTIENEIKHVQTYILIEKERYGNRFEIEFDLDTNIYRNLILQCSIQPLVENALRHGILVRSSTGIVQVSIKEINNKIMVCVKDNGVGCDASKLLQQINSDTYFESVALKNINSRLLNLYKEGLRIESEEYIGTTISFSYPLSETRY